MKVFEVNDGATWWVAANDCQEARAVWLRAVIDSTRDRDEVQILEESGEPDIKEMDPVDAAAVRIKSRTVMDFCPTCGGEGRVPHLDSALTALRKSARPRVLGRLG